MTAPFPGYEAAEAEKNRQKEQARMITERARIFYLFPLTEGGQDFLYELIAPDGHMPEIGSFITLKDGAELITYKISTVQYSTMERPNGMLMLSEPRVCATELKRVPIPTEPEV